MEAMDSRTDAPSPFQNPGSATGSALAVIMNIQRVQLTTDAWWRVFIQANRVGLYLQWPVLVLTVLHYYSLIWFHKLMTNLLISGAMH